MSTLSNNQNGLEKTPNVPNHVKKSSIDREINKIKTVSDDYNVLAQYSDTCKAGKYFISDKNYSCFLDLITNEIKNGYLIHYLEKPSNQFNQIKLDLDLRFKPTNEEKNNNEKILRRYNNDFIIKLINSIVNILKQMIDISSSFKIYVQEKKRPKIDKQLIKDGIHIVIPEIVIDNEYLFAIREKMIKDKDIIESLNKINNCVTVEKTIDECIIDRNCWFIYGCGKPDDNGDYYRVSHIFKINKKWEVKELKESEINKLHTDISIPIQLFSNFGKQVNTEILDSFTLDSTDVPKSTLYNEETMLKILQQTDNNSQRRQSDLKKEDIHPYLKCLKKERVEDFHDWRKVGLALFNMDTRNYLIWEEWSKQSKKFDRDYCIKIWNEEYPKFTKYDIGLQSILKMAKEDNIQKFNDITKENKHKFFLKWICEHLKETYTKRIDTTTFAIHVKIYIQDYTNFNIACIDPSTQGIWYKFENHKWSEDKGANRVYLTLSDDLKKDFLKLHNRLNEDRMMGNQRAQIQYTNSYDNRINNTDIINNTNQEYSNETQNAYINKVTGVLDFISNQANRNNIIKELAQRSYDEEFISHINENKDIFVCKNGVLDLVSCEFRPGKPSDMSTISCGISYPEDIDSPEASDIFSDIQNYLDKMFVDTDIQDYCMNMFAECLTGRLTKEVFHIMTGVGSNGKSQLMKFLNEVFGDYFVSFSSSLLNTPADSPNQASPAIAQLKGKRFASSQEPDNKKPIQTDRLKELIGGDNLTGRYLHKDNITFSPQYNMFLSCNDIPDMPSTDDGVWRKIRIIPFESIFVFKKEDLYKLEDSVKYPNHFKADNDLEKKYKLWAPYFLHMLFTNFIKIKTENFNYYMPDKVLEATNKYKKESNIYEQFFHDKIENKPGYCISKTNAYKEFKNYAQDNNGDNKIKAKDFHKNIARFLGEPNKHTKSFHNYIINGIGEPIPE